MENSCLNALCIYNVVVDVAHAADTALSPEQVVGAFTNRKVCHQIILVRGIPSVTAEALSVAATLQEVGLDHHGHHQAHFVRYFYFRREGAQLAYYLVLHRALSPSESHFYFETALEKLLGK